VFTSTPAFTLTPTLGVGSMIVGDDGMTLVYVSAGEFVMGSEDGDDDASPEHSVYLDSYWIDQTEVTNAQYRLCVEAGACDVPEFIHSVYRDSDYQDHPVANVDWYDANDYCEWAGRRLPTEAEWEKAARGEEGWPYPWGDASPDSDLLNYDGNIGGTTSVGSYPAGASPYGAMDMAGNIWEWVADWYGENYYQDSLYENPTGADSGDYRVQRGGSWSHYEVFVRTAFRGYGDPDIGYGVSGFRCAMDAD
jgi:serine/threonine-protein kinase